MTELEEKQTDCPYCKDHAPAILTNPAISEFEAVIYNAHGDEATIDLGYEGDYDAICINYCPMCGRKLGD